MSNSGWMQPSPHGAADPAAHHDELLPSLPALPHQAQEGEAPVVAHVPGVTVYPEVAAPPPAATRALSLADHKVRISDAIRLPDPADRDAALISALRGVASELEAAEEARARADSRVRSARELFDWATGALAGYSKASEPRGRDLARRGRKRKGDAAASAAVSSAEAVDHDERFVPPDEGPLLPPLVATAGGGMSEMQVVAHRDAFYLKLCGVPHAELSNYTPPGNLANLKSRAQIDECIHIAAHWDTGVDGIDVHDFRRQHKTFYTKMKMIKENIGRRTGHHLRDLAGNEGKKAFCRLGKGDESLMYLSLDQLYDALFELHCLTGHRGWQVTKKLANMRYANLPQDQVRCFVDTCPICIGRGRGAPGRPKKLRLEEEDEDEEAYELHQDV